MPEWADRPGKAPALYMNSISAPSNVPSAAAPILRSTTAPGAGPVARNTSARVIASRTGRPDLRDSSIATGSSIDPGLAAEPAADLERRHPDVRLGDRRGCCAVSERTEKWPWLDTQICAWPSLFHEATQACGSI